MVKPLAWLLGKWRTENAHGHYPTIKDFTYIDEMEFFHIGQPNIQFTFYASHPETKKPLHREVGFLRINPDSNTVAFCCAQNIGLAEVEEGEVNGEELKIESHTMGRISFGNLPETRKLIRHFCRKGDELEYVVNMQTSKTPMTQHLKATYKKVD